MDQSLIYALVGIGIGALLLFFGLRLMKVAVAIVGFLIGFSIAGWLLSNVAWDSWVEFALQVLGGLIAGSVAFSFYRFAVSLSIAFMAGNTLLSIVTGLGVGSPESLIIAGIVGVIVFFIAQFLKVVDVFFAVATSLQGASLVVYGAYLLFHPSSFSTLNTLDASYTVVGLAWWWGVLWVVLAVSGLLFQLQSHRATQGGVSTERE